MPLSVNKSAIKDCSDDEECGIEDNTDPVAGVEELIEFSQILDIINDHSNPCWTSGQISEIKTPASEFSPLKGENEKKEKSDFGTVLLGVEDEKGLSKIDGYKYTDGDKTYYIYHGKKTQLAGDMWVMAEVSPNGVMDFKYFRFQNKQEQKVNIVGENNISLVKSPVQTSISPLGKNGRLFFQSQQGLIIQGSKESAPLIGNLIIPKIKSSLLKLTQ